MPWTETTRGQYRRDHPRYASDLTDAEWAVIGPHLPARRALGRPRKTDLREIVNALLYITATGCQWRMLPKDFPPRSTVQGYFYLWRDDGTWQTTNHCLVMQVRQAAGREASPTPGVIDTQSVKTTESGGISGGACPRASHRPDPGDAGKKIKGRKRHILTDTAGFLNAGAVDVCRDEQGETPEGWEDNPAKRSQKNTDARWTKKHGKSHYGYKNHVNIDRRHKLVRRYQVTDAVVHDSQVVEEILDPDNTASDVWADSAYRSAQIEAKLADKGLKSRVHRKGHRNKPLTSRQMQGNKSRSKAWACGARLRCSE